MAYKALYRTYRPQLFRDVVGQDAIVRMIQNAIANNKISHAYLLCGPRGTGKTTIARVFAKALNCETREEFEPCDRCTSCREISDSCSPDVIEIDAASNNGVDEIRNIRDRVGFLPSGAKYKIYIIDEVHMLTTGAFNALLKTLEEPPKHVVFILATTEPQKLPSTIISRCLRFDFKNVSIGEISKKIREVVANEEVSVSEEAINAISEAAEGGLRDALSILDQAISYAEDRVTIEEVNAVTGNLSSDKLIELAKTLEDKDANAALEIIDDLISMGKEVTKLVNGLLQFYRDLLLYKNISSVVYSKYIFEKQAFKDLAESITAEKIFFYSDILSDVLAKVKLSANHRIYLETAIIKLINLSGEDLDFVKRIEKIEQKIDRLPLNGNNGSEGYNGEKFDLIAEKFDHFKAEIYKLDLHKIKEKLDDMEIKLSTANQTAAPLDSNLNNDLDNIKETVLILKTSYTGMVNRLVSLEETTDSLNEIKSSLTSRNNQTNKSDFININNDIKFLREDIENLKDALRNLYDNPAPLVSEVIKPEIDNSLIDKINAIEKKLYELISGELASKPTTVAKKPKVAKEQIALFANDLTPLEEFRKPSVKEETNFASFAKEEPQPSLKTNPPVEEPQVTKPVIFDGQELVRHEVTPHSQLVITKKIVPEEEIKTPQVEEVKKEDSIVFNSNIQDGYSLYDIKIIERIMNNAVKAEERNDANRVKQLWDNLERNTSPSDAGIASTLKLGRAIAVGAKEIVLIYNDYVSCNRVMRPTFKNKALRLLYDLLGDVYQYIALPEQIWNNLRSDFAKQYSMGVRPLLSPLDPQILDQLRIKEDYSDPKEEIINKTVSFFGSDLVEYD